MTKKPEEIYEYVLDYKNSNIKIFNDESQSLYHRGNDIDIKIGSDLIVLASALIAVAGGLLLSQATNENSFLKIILIATVLNLFTSIGGGLWYYSDIQKFWKKWGDVKHEQAAILNEDGSKTVEGLEVVLKKVVQKGKEAPKQSKNYARKVQVYCFLIGVCLLIISIVSFSYFSQPIHAADSHEFNQSNFYTKNHELKF
jgi:hypothetical protein